MLDTRVEWFGRRLIYLALPLTLACSSSPPTPTAVPTSTSAPAAAVQPTATPTAQSTATAVPTNTATLTPTLTLTPTVEPSAIPTSTPTAPPTATPTVVPPTALPAKPAAPAAAPAPAGFNPRDYIDRGDAFNCPNFRSQAEAQAVLRAAPSDPNRLDADKDGIACENNPVPKDLIRVPR